MPLRMHLRDIQIAYNSLCPEARLRGINAREWTAVPALHEHGMRRLNELRAQLGYEAIQAEPSTPRMHRRQQAIVAAISHDPGATLPLRAIFNEWNTLAEQARARGMDVRSWTGLPHTARRGMDRLLWLRQELGQSTAPVTPAILERFEGMEAFAGMTFGVELECILPQHLRAADMARIISSQGVPCQAEVYNHAIRPGHWKIVTDGSLMDDAHGAEFVSPPLEGEEGIRQIRQVCKLLTANNARITQRCGYHLHIGAATMPLKFFKNVVRTYSMFEKFIDAFMAPSRRHNQYCESIRFDAGRLERAQTVDEIVLACYQDTYRPRSFNRYRKVNLQSWYQHKTVEFRQHQGTIDADKTEKWVRLCLRMALESKNGSHPQPMDWTLDRALAYLGCSSDEAAFFKERTEYFAHQQEVSVRRAASRLSRRREWNPMPVGSPDTGIASRMAGAIGDNS